MSIIWLKLSFLAPNRWLCSRPSYKQTAYSGDSMYAPCSHQPLSTTLGMKPKLLLVAVLLQQLIPLCLAQLPQVEEYSECVLLPMLLFSGEEAASL